MRILLLGSGGREHTLAWKIAQSPLTEKLFIAPGNAGTFANGTNVAINPNDFLAIGHFAISENIDLVIVGPEEPLVNGIYDYFKSDPSLNKISILGPSKEGALLEGSKDFAKDFMKKYGVPTADYQTFTAETIDNAIDFIKHSKAPYVIKADGLAAGKGVIILDEVEEAVLQVKDMLLNRRFGNASEKVVIEQFLSGTELSVFVLTDGKNWILLPEAKDYKRVGNGDTGLNTGGMGSISPVPFADETFMQKVKERIIKPTIYGLRKENIDYRGFIFFGLINVQGDPFVIEYNVRMGDPETESIIPRINSDLLPVLKSCADGNLAKSTVVFDSRAAATVMLVSGGYPGNYNKGYVIKGLDDNSESHLFHAGTTRDPDGNVITAGGRVIAVTSLARTAKEALNKSFSTVDNIKFEGRYYRTDIGFDIL